MVKVWRETKHGSEDVMGLQKDAEERSKLYKELSTEIVLISFCILTSCHCLLHWNALFEIV